MGRASLQYCLDLRQFEFLRIQCRTFSANAMGQGTRENSFFYFLLAMRPSLCSFPTCVELNISVPSNKHLTLKLLRFLVRTWAI